jgi:GNAT superfamily N-acetyltransferase
MVVSEALTRVTLSLADVPGGLALSDAAGWNQTGDDWRLFVRHGQAIGYRNSEGQLVATAAALPYTGDLGWISMVLVAPDWRHQGLAMQLLDACVQYLQQMSMVPVLDATPAGAPVYRRIGFETCFALARWEGKALANGQAVPDTLRPATGDDLQTIVALDTTGNGVARRFLLVDFLLRAASRAWIARDGSGFVITREGRRATQIGPLIAANETSALQLLDAALGSAMGPVFLDLPEHWTQLAAGLLQRGFVRQRPFVRMARGSDCMATAYDRLFVLAGPEFG